MAEAGLPDFRATIWFGLFAPSQDARRHPRSPPWRGAGRAADEKVKAALGRPGRARRAREPRRLRPLRRRGHRALEPHRQCRQHQDGVTDDHHSSWRAGRRLLAGVTGSARAADFPSRPMNWIVPFPPGGSNDIFARPIAAFVGHRLHQPVVVENRGGAGGTIGGMIAARSKPDGCTLLVVNPSLTFAPIVYAEFGLRPDARLRAGVGHRPGAGGAGRQSRQGRRQGSRGLPGAGAQAAGVRSTSARRASAPFRIWPSCCCSSGRASS